MLAFITSLRHPHNSADYAQVEALVRATLASILRQDDGAFSVWVVGNRRPETLPTCVKWVPVDFDPPSAVAGPRTGIAAILRDKGMKLAVGLSAARREGARHVMFVDADDFVSRRLAGFVAQHPQADGWTVTHGWRVNVERRAVRAHRGDFDRQCGSSHIVRTDLFPDAGLPLDASPDRIHTAYGDLLERWLGSHMQIGDDLALPPLPFAGALYRVGTTESHSGNSLGRLGRPITRTIARDFGVPRTPLTPLSLARAILPSRRAFVERGRGVLTKARSFVGRSEVSSAQKPECPPESGHPD